VAEQMTPAGELRAAAKLMRERAQAATEGPWSVKVLPPPKPSLRVYVSPNEKHMIVNPGGNVADGGRLPDAEHIASWHPGVALAVADWLELYAVWFDGAVIWETPECTHEDAPCGCGPMQPDWYHSECDGFMGDDGCVCFDKGIAVARAYVGTEGSTNDG
jgi:hypothetical protein